MDYFASMPSSNEKLKKNLKNEKYSSLLELIDNTITYISNYSSDHSSNQEFKELLLLQKNAYIMSKIILSETTDTQIFQTFTETDSIPVRVKRVSKSNARLCAAIMKESSILKYLSQLPHESIIKHLNFFESETHIYLSTEYVHNPISLQDFVTKSQQYMKNNKLKSKHYKSAIKYILWQTAKAIDWLHSKLNRVHLDINAENVLLTNWEFNINSNGMVSMNSNIKIKLIANVNNEKNYNACKFSNSRVDLWWLGTIAYLCFFGVLFCENIPLTIDNQPKKGTAHWAICNNKLTEYIKMSNMAKTVSPDMVSLLNCLLTDLDERKQLNSKYIVKHKCFKKYNIRCSRAQTRKVVSSHSQTQY